MSSKPAASLQRFVFILCLLISSAISVAVAAPDYVKVYHPVINRAELQIMDKNYAEALASYQEAFAAVPDAFARDYYNATVCALLANNEKQTFAYLQALAQKGVSLDYLKRQPVFDSLEQTKPWRKFERKYSKYHRVYKRKANLDLRADLDELYARDQYFRQAEGGLRVYGDTLRKIEADNVKKLLSWVDKYGYPGEALIGVADTLEQLPRFSIVMQRQTKASRGYDFTPVLRKAVHEGRLAPQVAAYLMDVREGDSKYKSRALVKVNCTNPEECEKDKKLRAAKGYLVEKMSKKELKQVDEERAQLGLETLSEYRDKIRFNLKDNRFKLSNNWAVANYFVPSSEAARVIMQNLVAAD
ncbi:hypothetical protein [Pontibacter arcticus]|uniref:Tetratricopeptide repeat protein n=1 Tax=Pontibacter arcticus TaxID=2080288 RepID=A0A364RB47_9BACT|nr:hypothetical protein [Pontibacter arcticus]RAU81504.1 hypothetical protein DP923_15460 [Pontibacter arcticus]